MTLPKFRAQIGPQVTAIAMNAVARSGLQTITKSSAPQRGLPWCVSERGSCSRARARLVLGFSLGEPENPW